MNIIKIRNQSNQMDEEGSKILIPVLGTETNIFSPIPFSSPQRVYTSYSSNLKQLLLFSSPLWSNCLKMHIN